jgi:hypothetical protein
MLLSMVRERPPMCCLRARSLSVSASRRRMMGEDMRGSAGEPCVRVYCLTKNIRQGELQVLADVDLG